MSTRPSLSKMIISPLLNELSSSPNVSERGLEFLSLDDALFSEPAPGYATWQWGEIETSDRLELTYLFEDQDGTSVLMSIVAGSDKKVKEIEFWKGDGSRVQRIPILRDLVQPKLGTIY